VVHARGPVQRRDGSLRLLPLIVFFIFAALFPVRRAGAATIVQLIDNERFSVIRITFAPGEKQAALHPPPGTGQIVTLVTPAEVEVNLVEDGKPRTEKGHMEPGKVWWLAKTTLHQYANTGTQPYDIIVVTFK
jgi:predicted metal-dependent enzyme (double-stranded beta helix superfamily)